MSIAKNAVLNELEEALAHGSAERRIKTLRRVTDLFVFGSSHFSDDHIAVFDGVFGHLIADIELSARETLAQRLAAVPNAPPKVIRTLALKPNRGEAHHVARRDEKLTRYDVRNGICLCSSPCHERVTGRVGEKWISVGTTYFTVGGRRFINARQSVIFKKGSA